MSQKSDLVVLTEKLKRIEAMKDLFEKGGRLDLSINRYIGKPAVTPEYSNSFQQVLLSQEDLGAEGVQAVRQLLHRLETDLRTRVHALTAPQA